MVVSQLCYTWEQATLEVLKFNLGSKANGYKTIIIYFYCLFLCASASEPILHQASSKFQKLSTTKRPRLSARILLVKMISIYALSLALKLRLGATRKQSILGFQSRDKVAMLVNKTRNEKRFSSQRREKLLLLSTDIAAENKPG